MVCMGDGLSSLLLKVLWRASLHCLSSEGRVTHDTTSQVFGTLQEEVRSSLHTVC